MAILELQDGYLKIGLAVLIRGIISFVAFVIVHATYKLTFHPLAKYPGPFLAKLTDGYFTYHAWKGDMHLEFWRCHEKYGPVVRFGPNRLSFNTDTALHAIYSNKSNCLKSEFYKTFWAGNKDGWSTVSGIDKVKHAQRRRIASQVFSPMALKAMEPIIMSHVQILCDVFKSSTEPFNTASWFSYLTLDVLTDLCFGKSFNLIQEEESRFVPDLIHSAARKSLVMGSMPVLERWGLEHILIPGTAAGNIRFGRYAREQAAKRAAIETDRKDFFTHLLAAKDPETGEGLNMTELWAEARVFLVAGSDTTTTALAASLFYLTRNRSALDKLTQEVREKFKDTGVEGIHSGPELTSCTYLRACIDEALRILPPAPTLLPREVLPGGMKIGGEIIPSGTIIGVPTYTIHHNENYYPSPFEFRPERWLSSENDAETLNRTHSAFCPFSIGPRSCLGKPMAYMEMSATMARIVYQFDVERAGDLGEGKPGAELGRHRKGEFQARDVFASMIDGPLVRFIART